MVCYWLLLLSYCEANLDRSPNIVLRKKRLNLFTTTSLSENRTKMNNYLRHCTERTNHKEHKLTAFSQNEQLERRSLKKVRASTGFKPVTSAIPVRCSTNWAMKPHIGSKVKLLSSYPPVRNEMMWCIYEIIHIWTAVVDESEEWSSQYIFQFKQLERRSLKKVRASTGFERVTSVILVRCSTNWVMKPHIRI